MSFEALRNLKQLFEEGFIDEQEFTNRKRLIIDQLTKTKLQAAEVPSEAKEKQQDDDQPNTAPLEYPLSHIPGSPIKRKRMKSDEYDEEEPMNDIPLTDPNETYTWSELIERALLSLGGSRTGHEITDWIEEKFGHIVNHKTKTWKNSVFGCLSSNARKRWLKEQSVVNGKRRFVWRLNRGNHHHLVPTNLPIPELPPSIPKVMPMPPELSSPLAAKTLSALCGPKKPKRLGNFETNNGPQSPSKASLLLLSSIASTTTPTKPKRNLDAEFPLLDEDTPLEAELGLNSEESPMKSDLDSSFIYRPEGTPAKESDPNSFLSLVEQCLYTLGGKRSGAEIADWIAINFPRSESVLNSSKRSLRYSVNATLSSKKHAGVFIKDTSGDRTLWSI